MPAQKKSSIIHLDMDAFFASVEQRENPAYRDKALIVGGIRKENGQLSRRGVVCSASYQARKYGIHAGMPIWEAQQRCPEAIFTPARIYHYSQVSQCFFRICREYTPFIEPLGIDEVFLDVTTCQLLFGPAEAIAQKIKTRVREELHLNVSVGIASNKFLAKIATNLSKPNGFFILPDEKVSEILSPLSVNELWGIGHKTAQRLNRSGIYTIQQLTGMPDAILQGILGENGPKIKQLAQGTDPSPVHSPEDAKSIGKEITFPENISNKDRLINILLDLSQHIGYTARKKGFSGRTITLKIRSHHFRTFQKSITLPQATNLDDLIFQKSRELLNTVAIKTPGIRLLGLKLSSLQYGQQPQQLSLMAGQDPLEKWKALIESVDKIREKHGAYFIQRASLLEKSASSVHTNHR